MWLRETDELLAAREAIGAVLLAVVAFLIYYLLHKLGEALAIVGL